MVFLTYPKFLAHISIWSFWCGVFPLILIFLASAKQVLKSLRRTRKPISVPVRNLDGHGFGKAKGLYLTELAGILSQAYRDVSGNLVVRIIRRSSINVAGVGYSPNIPSTNYGRRGATKPFFQESLSTSSKTCLTMF
ncbi:MAG: hypothetical protein Q9213_002560 [Squamulea squamosa]